LRCEPWRIESEKTGQTDLTSENRSDRFFSAGAAPPLLPVKQEDHGAGLDEELTRARLGKETRKESLALCDHGEERQAFSRWHAEHIGSLDRDHLPGQQIVLNPGKLANRGERDHRRERAAVGFREQRQPRANQWVTRVASAATTATTASATTSATTTSTSAATVRLGSDSS
jgi:hypothetical protein